jgi:NAD(P)-dependent dehydrogenase (short-subunit alcohol dehydrogenase family)
MHAKDYTLVTGAGSGIGLALVKELSRLGYPVIAHVHKERAALDEVRRQSSEGSVHVVHGDFSTTRGIIAFLKRLNASNVRVRHVVHCAATHEKKEFSQITKKEAEHIFSVNTYAPLLITQELLKQRGRLVSVVFLGTMYAFSGGSSRSVVYTGSKSALIGIARTMALYAAPTCRINVVVPGFVDSPLLFKGTTSRALREKKARTPLKRFVRTEEIVSTVTYLLSPKSEAVTGQMFHVNGGLYFG